MPRGMKKDYIRGKLIKHGTELFYKKGFARSSIRDIGRAAGITSATLYYYFKNKDQLLYEIIKSIGDYLLAILDQTTREFADPEERLKQMVLRQISLLGEKRKEVKVYIEEQYQLPPRLKKIVYQQHRKVYDTYLQTLEEISKAKRLRINHLPTINFTMFAVMNWVYRWFKDDGGLTIEEVASMITCILFNGIFMPEGKTPILRKKLI
jgi:TetR/AcrR family transcriptional regulator